MIISKETAEMIYKAIVWCNNDWCDALGWELTEEEKNRDNINDFFRFCENENLDCVVLHP